MLTTAQSGDVKLVHVVCSFPPLLSKLQTGVKGKMGIVDSKTLSNEETHVALGVTTLERSCDNSRMGAR